MSILPSPGQLVRITANAPGSYHDVAGQVGFIEIPSPPDGKHVQVHLIDTDGRLTGVGHHPNMLLEIENDPLWIHALKLYQQRVQAFEQEAMQRTQRWQAFVSTIAAEYGLSTDTVLSLYTRMRVQDEQY